MDALIKILFIILLNIFAEKGFHLDLNVQSQEENRISTAALIQVVTPLQTIGNTLYYGDIVIKLPDGITAEWKDPSLDNQFAGDVIDLKGMDNADVPLAPRLWITHYRAQCANETELIGALLEQLPGITLRLWYWNFMDNVKFFTYSNKEKAGYILLCKNEIYFVEELMYEGKYIFKEWVNNHAVTWKDKFEYVGDTKNNENIILLNTLQLGEDSFLALRYTDQDGRRWLKLFCDKEPSKVWQEIEIAPIEKPHDEVITYNDYNFDGYLDMNISAETIYLWKPDTKQYEATQVPSEFLQLQSKAYFLDTEVIWGYKHSSVEPGYQNNYDEIETLWKWTEDRLVKKRACKAQIRGESVQISAFENTSDNKIFDSNFTLEQYQESDETVQKLYQEFYENMVPAETFTHAHTVKYDKKDIVDIPQELLDLVADAMLSGTEVETLKPMLNDRVLSDEEILSIAENNIDLRQTVIDKTWRNPYIMVMTDGDNDGVMDIIARESYGGSDGSVEFVFYQGQENGTFQHTDAFPSMQEEFGTLLYKDKNYLFRTLFDYNKKIYNGLSISYYIDGKRVEEAVLMLVPKNYKTILTECTQQKYKSYAEQIAMESFLYKIYLQEESSIIGNSEQKLADYGKYQCDLNNDGVIDTYRKELWEPSSIYICEYLYFDGDGKAIAPVKEALDSLDGTPIMMWVDLVEDKNIINVMAQTGLEEFTITGFIVNDLDYEKLYEVCVDVTYTIDIKGTRM